MRIDCSAPTRVDLAGGTLDIWPIYLFHQPAVTINAAISLRAHCRVESRVDSRVVLVSEDTGERVEASCAADLDVDRLALVARLIRHFGTDGITLTTRSDSPVGAGLGGSSAMAVAIIAALAAWTKVWTGADADRWLTLAMNIEAQVLGVPTGVQDYRPAFHGGLAAIEMDPTGVRRTALVSDPAELERRLVLAYTGATRNSGINNWDMMKRHIDGDPQVAAAFAEIAAIAGRMRDALERQDWPAAGRHLADEWTNRKRLAPGVTTSAIDDLIAQAIEAGAAAGKVCGAGGGGCVFCLVEPGRRDAVIDALAHGGARVLPFTIEREGVRIVRSS